MPITKHTWMVTDPADIPRVIREAFHIASTGRPGPVLVDLPKDVLIKEADFEWPDEIDLPGYKPTTKGNVKQVREAVELIMDCRAAGASTPAAGSSAPTRRTSCASSPRPGGCRSSPR